MTVLYRDLLSCCLVAAKGSTVEGFPGVVMRRRRLQMLRSYFLFQRSVIYVMDVCNRFFIDSLRTFFLNRSRTFVVITQFLERLVSFLRVRSYTS
ncbi:hypothetical protein F5Y00DRAFT_224634 [Daldinia vernicosa]|uniref:uncharacterized protein n=1 Tax=Daldinia vernicosa TaxID=114800 RepID=UPI0020077F1F|nr:uncharacterized protein F5Y00DRAFT_224634 [Daldinia vernicosa]KAI0853406.1 hypothetical protein F5Y00DRAFT_224634 [Daldinia vernicosa]